MIVTLDDVKNALGLSLTDSAPDDNLTRIIKAKTAWIEGTTHRRFGAPIPHTQIIPGNGEDQIYLEWYVDDSASSSPVITVERRPQMERYRAWETLTEGSDWERIGQALYFLRFWAAWPKEDEFRVTYPGGYVRAPEDIKELLVELTMNQYLLDTAVSNDSAGVTSETIGDYTYSVGTSTNTAKAGTDVISSFGQATIQRYKRRLV